MACAALGGIPESEFRNTLRGGDIWKGGTGIQTLCNNSAIDCLGEKVKGS